MKQLKILFCVAVLALAGVTQADALYWQVDTANAGVGGYSGSDVAYAQLFAVAKDAEFDYSSSKITLGEDAFVAVKDDKPYLTDLGSYGSSSYSFFVELYNNSGETLHTGYAVNYNDLLASGYISTSGVLTPTTLATSGFNGAAVPEPTSGVLLLIGGAMLALRRRRRA